MAFLEKRCLTEYLCLPLSPLYHQSLLVTLICLQALSNIAVDTNRKKCDKVYKGMNSVVSFVRRVASHVVFGTVVDHPGGSRGVAVKRVSRWEVALLDSTEAESLDWGVYAPSAGGWSR